MNFKTAFPDLLLTIPAILLLSLSILIIYSSSPQQALLQFVIAVAGFVIYWLLSFVDFEGYSNYVVLLYILVIILLVIVFFLGLETRGSTRWISLGSVNLQPSEIAKPILILMMATYWNNHRTTWLNIAKSFLILLPVVGLVFIQPDLGTALILMTIWLFMLLAANISLVKVAMMIVTVLAVLPLGWFFLKDYQKERILVFLSPERDPLGAGYNVIQSTIAVGSGQLLGRGLGRGTQSRLQFLPEYRTDFIFASIAEELGFLGSALVLLLYGIIFGRALKIIADCRSRFGGLLVFGVLGMLFCQLVVNIGMNIGIMPVTGITLPFLSYGGSSLIATFVSLALVASVARSILRLELHH